MFTVAQRPLHLPFTCEGRRVCPSVTFSSHGPRDGPRTTPGGHSRENSGGGVALHMLLWPCCGCWRQETYRYSYELRRVGASLYAMLHSGVAMLQWQSVTKDTAGPLYCCSFKLQLLSWHIDVSIPTFSSVQHTSPTSLKHHLKHLSRARKSSEITVLGPASSSCIRTHR